MQVVPYVGKFHPYMVNIFIIFHTNGVCFLQWITKETISLRHLWSNCFSCGYSHPILCCIQRQSDIQDGLQTNPYRSSVSLLFPPTFHFANKKLTRIFHKKGIQRVIMDEDLQYVCKVQLSSLWFLQVLKISFHYGFSWLHALGYNL